ncbi:MAG: alpha/beta fold hydrolase [Holophagae bacterium]
MSEQAPVLFHRTDGSGEPVLLLNGVAMTVPSWELVARPLAERYEVTRCDFRGQLMMPAPPPAHLTDHADDVVALLDHLGCDSAHVIGTSFGGVVGILLASRHPDRVRSLVTIASADGFDEGMADEVARWRDACEESLTGGDRGHLSDVLEPVVYSADWVELHRDERAVRRRQIASLPDEWFRNLMGLLDTAHSLRIRDELGAVRCPTLVVAAELDAFVPLDRARDMAAAIDGASFEIIEGAGHAVVVEQPDRVVELCRSFLERLD